MTYAELIQVALKNYQPDVEVVSAYESFSSAARQNDKRPAKLELFVPDEWVVNMTKNPKLSDAYLVVRLPREVLDRAKSPVVLATEV